jgi:hypothetical protein
VLRFSRQLASLVGAVCVDCELVPHTRTPAVRRGEGGAEPSLSPPLDDDEFEQLRPCYTASLRQFYGSVPSSVGPTSLHASWQALCPLHHQQQLLRGEDTQVAPSYLSYGPVAPSSGRVSFPAWTLDACVCVGCRFIKPSVEQLAVDARYDAPAHRAAAGAVGVELAATECCVCMVRGVGFPQPRRTARAMLGGGGDAKSSLGDAKSSLGDAKSSLGDAESSLGDAKSSLGDAESSLGDARSSLGDGKSSLADATSSLGDAKSSLGGFG